MCALKRATFEAKEVCPIAKFEQDRRGSKILAAEK